jgi:hypothetical protein
MSNYERVSLNIQPIANGFLVSAEKVFDDFGVTRTPFTYFENREEVVAWLPSLLDHAEKLSRDDSREDF